MQTMAQLQQIREQMIEELTQIPQYRALKAMERFMAEFAAIYETPSVIPETQKAELQDKISQAIEARIRRDAPAAAAPHKITPYIPSHRVA